MAKLVIQLMLVERITVAQEKNPRFVMLKANVNKGEALNFYVMSDGILRFWDQLFVPNDEEFKREVGRKLTVHSTSYIRIAPRLRHRTRDLQDLFNHFTCHSGSVKKSPWILW